MDNILKLITELARMNGEWLALTDVMRRVIRGTATAHELQVLVEHIDNFERRMKELEKFNDELIARSL